MKTYEIYLEGGMVVEVQAERHKEPWDTGMARNRYWRFYRGDDEVATWPEWEVRGVTVKA